jgi:hypothetical protein
MALAAMNAMNAIESIESIVACYAAGIRSVPDDERSITV